MKIDLGARVVEYELTRSKRARFARLEVHFHRGVRVVLPRRAPDSEAERFLKSKARWLLRHLARFDRLQKIVPDRRFVTGTKLPLLGGELTLEVLAGPPGVERRDDALAVSMPAPNESAVRYALEDWYQALAEDEVERRVRDLAARFGIIYRSVRVSDAKTRWGTCSSTGRLRFNWRLMLAPSEILDYMVAHELAHVDRKNHSPEFWARVAELYPAYAESERWLKRNGRSLVL
ncbi:MAG TPA: SprT family zinc-dependent metalloprotease [Thermoanaerobaculia bacterium]